MGVVLYTFAVLKMRKLQASVQYNGGDTFYKWIFCARKCRLQEKNWYKESLREQKLLYYW